LVIFVCSTFEAVFILFIMSGSSRIECGMFYVGFLCNAYADHVFCN
jgi:hypothetical protein